MVGTMEVFGIGENIYYYVYLLFTGDNELWRS